MNEQIQFSSQVKNKLKPKYWFPVPLVAFLQFYGSSVFAQCYPTAFLADIHLEEVYVDLNSEKFKGVPHHVTGKLATIGTMRSPLNSTTLFNENYFAFLGALEEQQEKK